MMNSTVIIIPTLSLSLCSVFCLIFIDSSQTQWTHQWHDRHVWNEWHLNINREPDGSHSSVFKVKGVDGWRIHTFQHDITTPNTLPPLNEWQWHVILTIIRTFDIWALDFIFVKQNTNTNTSPYKSSNVPRSFHFDYSMLVLNWKCIYFFNDTVKVYFLSISLLPSWTKV